MVINLEKEAFRRKLEKLAADGSIEDAVFADLVYTTTSRFGIGEQVFRDAFGLTKGAVERWSQMKNLPQPVVRPKILAWIAAQI